ncbi:helix-turn-helix domain-containing protein [uncultured Dysosmobacter sp.]|uniref:helix-turn-helix domain-containing protein n=1 Tax=uncultured Dysosmobacter sp. TaxID=2591384 RepID=UPI002632E2BF|nr:helix-turn-helix transcriptional regulator [uncultured Dysosmobacter sp.]
MTTGQRIKAARKKAGLTQRELGAKLGVTYQTLAQWENDLRNPKQETVQRIADALKCDFYWLLWGEELSIEERHAYNVMRVFATEDYHIEKAAKLAVYYAEREHKSKGYSFSAPEETLVTLFNKLNDDGQQKAVERVEELTEIPKYQRQDPPTEAPPEGTDTASPESPSEGTGEPPERAEAPLKSEEIDWGPPRGEEVW